MKKILLIDDDPTICEYAKQLLIKENYFTQSVNAVIAAEQYLEIEKYDLILCDINLLEGPSGLDFLKSYRSKNKITKFAIMSGRKSEADVDLAINLGADDYLVKPFDSDLFLTKVYRMLPENNAEKHFFPEKTVNHFSKGSSQTHIYKISEEGMALFLSKIIVKNSKFKVQSEIFDDLGIQAPWIRVNSCTSAENGKFLAQVSFIGMPEKETQKIRAYLVQHPDKKSYSLVH